jgi:hypothetical protein
LVTRIQSSIYILPVTRLTIVLGRF